MTPANRLDLAAHLQARSELLRPAITAAGELDLELALVGGAVRDLALGLEPPELDLVVLGGSSGVDRLVAALRECPGWVVEKTHERFGTASLREARKGMRVDLAAARTETYASPGALPVVSLGASLEADLGRRDFTINAMALRLPGGELVDPFLGWEDLQRRSLRLLHRGSLADDPTRALRAARYSARLDFTPESVIFSEAMAESLASGAWRAISGDRLRVSLAGVLSEPGWKTGFSRVVAPWKVLDAICGRPVGLDLDRAPSGRPLDWRALLAMLDREASLALVERLTLSRKLLKKARGT